MKMTFQPKKRSRSKVHGFRARMSTAGGRKVLAARRAKGRKQLSAQAAILWPFLLYRFIFQKRYVEAYEDFNEKEIIMKFSESLKKNKDFQTVYRQGKSYANKYLVLYIMENQTEKNRIGISVSKKVGNSVVRHHLTRLIRESYRLQEECFQRGYDLVVIARQSAKDVTFKEMESALIHLGKLHKIYKTVQNTKKIVVKQWKK